MMPQFFFSLLRAIERQAARAQGKGYGGTTVRQEVRQMAGLCRGAPALAIDVGGNAGEYTAELRRRFAQLEVHVFEPSATNVARLRARFVADARVTIAPVALSDQEGAATLFADKPGSGLASLTQRKLEHFNMALDSTEAVRMVRFEDYWRDVLGSRPLDIVKIDVEGHELAVLRGFGAALQATRLLQFEFGGCAIDTRTYLQDFWYFFRERGFALMRITPFGLQELTRYRENDEIFKTTNFIAVNRG